VRAVGVEYSSGQCDDNRIRVKSSVIIKVCFSHQRSAETKQTQSKEFLESFRGKVVQGQEAEEGHKIVFKDSDWGGNLDFTAMT